MTKSMSLGEAILSVLQVEFHSVKRGDGTWLKAEQRALARALPVIAEHCTPDEYTAIKRHLELED